MSRKGVLSSKYNMSLGFIPVIVSIVLCEFIAQDISIYTSTSVGIIYSLYTFWDRNETIPNFTLYGTTGMFLLLTVTTLLFGDICAPDMLPLTLEISTLIPSVIIFLNRKRLLARRFPHPRRCRMRNFTQGAEASIVSSRVVILMALLHFLTILVAILLFSPLDDAVQNILFCFCPPAVFILSILFNQFGILYFNSMMKDTAFVPIVNTKGDVIGKCLATDAVNRKNKYINPVIRIAISHNGMLYLRPRPQHYTLEGGRTDIPMECYLLYKETLEHGIVRLMKQTYPQIPIKDLKFNVRYHFENQTTNRLIYLFLIDIKDERLLHNKHTKDGKLWTFQQIKQNLGKNFFSSCFENEYEHLKEVIYTKEKYKES
ncbi:hypothetical protein [uncultured Bacteroides sp.]|uniref:hypothetical protein n=1 Tax=uncultured Bacteroides sp. TaxID=162156 RepID=UPI0026109D33|nr:hypothetical protein [uncultured Bacteroides sp.]